MKRKKEKKKNKRKEKERNCLGTRLKPHSMPRDKSMEESYARPSGNDAP
jgi:hypothetical protein